jgi:uncharacterized protein (DUF302 family)
VAQAAHGPAQRPQRRGEPGRPALRETTLVVFGNPVAGTPVMVAAPLAALDLPLKVLVWTNNGQTKVSYYGPVALAARDGLSADLAARLAAIDAITDALIAP